RRSSRRDRSRQRGRPSGRRHAGARRGRDRPGRPRPSRGHPRRRLSDAHRARRESRGGNPMTAITTTADAAVARAYTHEESRGRLATWWSDSLVFAGRNIEHIRQIPEKLLDVTLQPLMFVLLFSYVFGGAIHVGGGSYREYIIAGILVQSLAFG